MKELAIRVRSFVVDAADNMFVIYAEKGIEPFKKPLIISGAILLAIYVAIYNPLSGRIRAASARLNSTRAISQGAGEYQDAKKRLMNFQTKLPLLKDKDDWLSYLLLSTSKVHGISFDALSAQKEESNGSFLLVSRNVEFVTAYDTLGKWLADIESSPISLKIVSLTAARDEENPLNVKVSMKLSTIFMKPGSSSGGAAK
jgi:type II secretory pathway component PulM